MLVTLVDDRRMDLDRGRASQLILLDLSASLDNHCIPSGVPDGVWVSGTVLGFCSFLSGVPEGGARRVLFCPLACSLWGSIPGVSAVSILFSIYMKPAGEAIR